MAELSEEDREILMPEIKKFLDDLNQKQFEKIIDFFKTMPSVAHEIEFTNPKTSKQIPNVVPITSFQ